jgi:hypothetical protein
LSATDNPHPDEQWVIPPEPAAEPPVAHRAGRFIGPAKVLAPVVAALLLGGGAAFVLGHQSAAGASADKGGATAVLGGTRPSASDESRDTGEPRHSRDSDDSGEPVDGD